MANVIIVGAGPAGASLAFLLARRGIGVTLVERQTDFAREFRGEVLMPSAFEGLAQMGLAEAVAKVPQVPLRTAQAFILGRRVFRTTLDTSRGTGHPPSWVSQPGLLEMLVAQAERFPGFRLERGATVRDLLRREDRTVGVRVKTPDGERELTGDLVVGADGRASVVRRRSGIEAHTDRTLMDIVWCKVPLPEFMASDPHLRAYLGHGHLLIVAPTPDRRLQLGWVIQKGNFGELRSRGLSEWMEELANHVSPDLAEHLRTHKDETIRPFLLDAVADRVETWSAPGLLLIGDAAHTMSPVGAQGLNIAIRDAIVAANHLVPALTGAADPQTLDGATEEIERERLPEVRAIQRLQAIPPYVILSNSWWSKLVLRAVPSFLIGRAGSSAAFQRFAYGVTEVNLRV
ncbi:MAG: FAD-dependent oxidoreductase [Myxococcota bacterium]